MNESLIYLDVNSEPVCDAIFSGARCYGMVRYRLLVNKEMISLADKIMEDDENSYGFSLEISEEEGINIFFWDYRDPDTEHYIPLEDEEGIRERIDSQSLWLYGKSLDDFMKKAERAAKRAEKKAACVVPESAASVAE